MKTTIGNGKFIYLYGNTGIFRKRSSHRSSSGFVGELRQADEKFSALEFEILISLLCSVLFNYQDRLTIYQ